MEIWAGSIGQEVGRVRQTAWWRAGGRMRMSPCWQQQGGFVLGPHVYYIQQGCCREITATTLLCQHGRCDALGSSSTGWLLCSPLIGTTNSTSAKTHTSRVSMVMLPIQQWGFGWVLAVGFGCPAYAYWDLGWLQKGGMYVQLPTCS
jgi:hypothetical protein